MSSSFDIMHLIFGTRSCSCFARHLSCLFCRIILVPSDIYPTCSAGLFWFPHISFLTAVNPQLLPCRFYCLNIFSCTPVVQVYHKSPFAPLWLCIFYIFMFSCVTKFCQHSYNVMEFLYTVTVYPAVVPKVGLFTQYVKRQYTHRAEVFCSNSYLHKVGGQVVIHKARTLHA